MFGISTACRRDRICMPWPSQENGWRARPVKKACRTTGRSFVRARQGRNRCDCWLEDTCCQVAGITRPAGAGWGSNPARQICLAGVYTLIGSAIVFIVSGFPLRLFQDTLQKPGACPAFAHLGGGCAGDLDMSKYHCERRA